MEQQIVQIFSNPKLHQMIDEEYQKHHFSAENNIQLKALLLSIYLFTHEEQTIYTSFYFIVERILKHQTFNDILCQSIEQILLENKNDLMYSKKIIQNIVLDGYCFHSFNANFLPSIQKNGLTTDVKAWDNKEIEVIHHIFSLHQYKNVFGFYQFTKQNPIFAAGSLSSSSFYAYSSPAWYRNFVSGGVNGSKDIYDKTAFYTRNSNQAFQNIQILCKNASLNDTETNIVIEFFQKYWSMLATYKLPYVALIKKSDIIPHEAILPMNENETMIQYIKRLIMYYGNKNYIIKESIPIEKLILFPYQLDEISLINIVAKKMQ